MLFGIAVVCSQHCLHAINASDQGATIFALDTCGKHLALWAIRAYQRHLSPHKGFACAYRLLTGRDSCSAHGYRVIARHGLRLGLPLLRRRLHACGETHRQYQARQPHGRRSGKHLAQAGFCDCDIPTPDCQQCTCNPCDMLDCDWPRRKKKQ